MFVYRYIDKDSGTIKYVGKTKNLGARISGHKKDSWANDSDWEIEYIELETHSQADAYESHLIAFYETYKWYNVAKADWGTIPELEKVKLKWIPYREKAAKKYEFGAGKKYKKEEKTVITTKGMYETFNGIRQIMGSCNKECEYWVVNIFLKERSLYNLMDWVEFLFYYLSGGWLEAIEQWQCDIETFSHDVYCIISFKNGSKIYLFAPFNGESNWKRHLDLNNRYCGYSRIKGCLYGKEIDLEWTKEVVPIKGLDVYAKPASPYIKERVMKGKMVKDKKGDLYFQREANGKITDTQGEIAVIVPYGKTIEEYINNDLEICNPPDWLALGITEEESTRRKLENERRWLKCG